MKLRPLLLAAALLATAAAAQDLVRDAAAAFRTGDNATAIRLYREFLKDHTEAAEIRSNLGAALVRSGQFAEAIDEYRLALARLPNQPKVRMNLGLAYYKLGRFQEAAGTIAPLYERDPLDLNTGLLLGDCLVEAGDHKRAAAVLAPLAEEFPDERGVAYLLGVALLKLNRPAEAQAQLDRILRGGESAEGEYLRAQTDYAQQRLLTAVEHAAKAVKLNPQLAGVHTLYGQILFELAKQDEAVEQYRAELTVNAYDFTANAEVASALRQDGDYEAALRHISRALEVRPADAGARFQRTRILLLKGDGDTARRELEKLTADFPDFAEAHAALATLYYRLNRTADGDRERTAARKLNAPAQ